MSFIVGVTGVKELRDALWQFTNRPGTVLAGAYRRVAKLVEPDARAAITNAGAPSARMDGGALAAGIRGTAKEKYAALTIRSTSSRPTIAAALGANIHQVYGRKYPIQVLHGRQPWLEHLGNRWQPEDLYGIGPVLANKSIDEIVDVFWEAILESITGAGGEIT